MANGISFFESLIKIDKHNLDQELIQHSDYLYQISSEYSRALSVRDFAADNIKQVDAQTAVGIRLHFERAGEKLTEARLGQEVLASVEHKEAVVQFQKASDEANRWMNLKTAFEQRGYMLTELCKLYAANYFTRSAVRSAEEEQINKNRAILNESRRPITRTRVREEGEDE